MLGHHRDLIDDQNISGADGVNWCLRQGPYQRRSIQVTIFDPTPAEKM